VGGRAGTKVDELTDLLAGACYVSTVAAQSVHHFRPCLLKRATGNLVPCPIPLPLPPAASPSLRPFPSPCSAPHSIYIFAPFDAVTRKVLEYGIEDCPNNYTRFLLLSRSPVSPPRAMPAKTVSDPYPSTLSPTLPPASATYRLDGKRIEHVYLIDSCDPAAEYCICFAQQCRCPV